MAFHMKVMKMHPPKQPNNEINKPTENNNEKELSETDNAGSRGKLKKIYNLYLQKNNLLYL